MSVSESVWWKDEPWWEKKTIPLGIMMSSPRQLTTLVVAASLGLVISIPVGLAAGLFGRVAVLAASVFVGLVISRKRVKLIAVEMQLLFLVLGREAQGRKGEEGKEKEEKALKTRPAEPEQELVVEDFKDPPAYSITGRIRRAKGRLRLFLYVDEERRAEDYVDESKSEWWFVYLPLRKDIGAKEIVVRMEDAKDPLMAFRLTVKEKGVTLLEAKK